MKIPTRVSLSIVLEKKFERRPDKHVRVYFLNEKGRTVDWKIRRKGRTSGELCCYLLTNSRWDWNQAKRGIKKKRIKKTERERERDRQTDREREREEGERKGKRTGRTIEPTIERRRVTATAATIALMSFDWMKELISYNTIIDGILETAISLG